MYLRAPTSLSGKSIVVTKDVGSKDLVGLGCFVVPTGFSHVREGMVLEEVLKFLKGEVLGLLLKLPRLLVQSLIFLDM